MSKFTTKHFGEIEVDEAQVLTMPEGLLGFPEYKRFVLLDLDPESPFKHLQSLDDGMVNLTVMDPSTVRRDYVVFITEDIADQIELEDANDAVVAAILCVPSNPQNMTINLKGPLVFNLKSRRGVQVVMEGWGTRHNVMDEARQQALADVEDEMEAKYPE